MAGWVHWAGPPRFLIGDLDSAFKDQFLERLDQMAVHIRCAAGQAHWQNSERQGESWKAIWKKHVEANLIMKDEAAETMVAINAAKNSLRNRSGYSPRQWVFGSNQRLPGDPFDAPEEEGLRDLASVDSKFARSQVLRMGARLAFTQVQACDTLKRATVHKPRVEGLPFEPGSLVYVFRNIRPGKGKKPAPMWIGPATVLGREGSNYWTSRGGRCMLVAAEHLRPAEHEEISEFVRLKVAMKEIADYVKAEEEGFPEDTMGTDGWNDAGTPGPPAGASGDIEMEAVAEPDPRTEAVEEQEERIATASRRRNLLDDVPHVLKKPKVNYMTVHRKSEKGQAKQLEKELPWGQIPPEERHLYVEAERTQWDEHLAFGAVRPLTLEESDWVRKHEDPSRILSARFAYRDKRHAQRKVDPSIAPKPKARLCVAGQNDPDLGVVDLTTEAPTANRHSVLLALQLGLSRGWRVSVGDVRAAFLNGVPAPRKLFFRQPKRGIPGLAPGQLVEIIKGVFGLSTSPKLWWLKLSSDLKSMQIQGEDEGIHVQQNSIDPCVFMLVGDHSAKVRGLLLTHVDDLLLLTEEGLRGKTQTRLKELFPVDDWEDDSFSYVGCEYVCSADEVTIKQKSYCESRVDKVTISGNLSDDSPASAEQVEENRTAIGSVSWLAKMTRPDLQFQVSQAQRKQNKPTVKDLKETNKLVDNARAGSDRGLVLRRVPESEMILLAFHDAAWGNVHHPDVTAEDLEWHGDHTLSSQLASLVVVCDRRCLHGKGGKFGVVEWKSKASQRVCRSTFAGETMACSDALESAIFLRGLLVSMMAGHPVPEDSCGEFMEIHLVTDCKSLYDHIHREGTPKAPTEKRLALDLASVRQVLVGEARHQWTRLFGCGEPSPERSIASVVAERHRQKEQAADDRRREEERQAQAAQGHSKVNRRGALAALAQAALMEQKWAMWMVSPTSKKGSATLLRRNDWRQLLGPLTGEEVRIPDVNSGYPKGVYPTKWEDGQCQPVSVETFDLGGGFPDQNEFVMKFGVIIPSTNTTVEYDFWSMIMQNRDVCKGIGFHMSGILIDSPKLATDEDMLHFLQLFRKQIFTTVDRLMTSEPQYIIMGMSLETFFGGWEGNKEFKKELSDRTGLNIATGAEACKVYCQPVKLQDGVRKNKGRRFGENFGVKGGFDPLDLAKQGPLNLGQVLGKGVSQFAKAGGFPVRAIQSHRTGLVVGADALNPTPPVSCIDRGFTLGKTVLEPLLLIRTGADGLVKPLLLFCALLPLGLRALLDRLPGLLGNPWVIWLVVLCGNAELQGLQNRFLKDAAVGKALESTDELEYRRHHQRQRARADEGSNADKLVDIDPTSKEGTRAQERAQQRQQPTRPANRTQQGGERARPGQGTRPASRGPGSVLPHQHPTGSTRVAATSSARAHRRNTEAVHVPPNFAQVTWLDNGVPPTFPPSLPLQAYSQMMCLYRGSGRWDLRILSTSPDAEPFLAQGIYPQVLYVDQTRRRVHGEPETPGEVELHRGDSFLIIWEEDGWTLFERYPGDVAAWTTTVMPAGTEVSHHNHILLPSQQVYDGEIPQAAAPDANGSQARGHRSGDSTPHKAAPPRPPSSSTSSGNRSERAWASEDGRDQPEGEHDRTELMQRNPPHPHGGSPPNKPAYTTATAAAPHSGASEELEPWRSSSNHRKRGQPTPAQHPPQQAPEAEHPLFGAPSTQTQEEMLAVAHLVETGQANSVAWTGNGSPTAQPPPASLEKFGAKRITVITPYQDIGDRNVVKFFSEIGIEVVRIAGLKCGSATDIAHVLSTYGDLSLPEAWCEKVVRENLLLPDIDAVVQCGTNLSFVNLADRLEREVGIPIVAINVACLWFAMREVGIDAKLQGCTRLFREH
ncbi:Copia protein [Symbiodinium microadriaticum]|uniref:Copia protein n=1 Tax=Symbiodinium microadriaticum TaxID=2951 RepID=A0A1Q9EC96_SYMMI|nr:Copia protein [Symbiodinium microadriaticum]